ncbi:hypothetical protein Taro_035129 [Colocasia esculenta]|uniref:Uncharacterized protein n=1 Tax=Colocasia esculenta TaxID=4460 RepID=A0A843VZL6_COLES|nr:hypothetical protein [Colocasia esculenta]
MEVTRREWCGVGGRCKNRRAYVVFPAKFVTSVATKASMQHFLNVPFVMTFPTVSELWICDACGEKKETMQMPHTSSPFSRTKESAKVKFISAEEVASLALGCQTPVSCARRRLCTSVTRTDSILKKPSLMSKSMSTQPTARVELQGYPEEKTSGISTPPGFQPLTVDNETPPKSSSAMNSEDVLASPQPGSGESQLTRSDSRSDLWLSSLHKKNEHLMPPDKALELNTKVYLWGIFRHRRTKKPNQETGFSGEGKHTEAKMQIDMIGGNDTGKADKPVVKRPGMQKEHMDNHRSALLKLQKSHEEQNFPSVPPGFSKPRKVDWNCNKKPLVKLITKKPDSHTISDLPPSFFEQINLKHESGSSKSTGKSLIPPVYEKGNAASNGTRGQHIISCLSAEKVNSMCYQKEQLDNHRSALLKLQKSHEEQNFPSVPPGFSKLRKVDWNCNKKPPVNLITKKPDSHTISDLPPSFFEQINLKHESGSSKSTGKSLIPPVYEKGNAASNGTRGQHIISCLSAEKENNMHGKIFFSMGGDFEFELPTGPV